MFDVIIPYFNHRQFILRTLLSLEISEPFLSSIIIVDDGSTDNGTNFLVDYEGVLSSRIKLVKQENRGAASAINRGVNESVASYLAVLNSDDISVPERFECAARLISENEGIEFMAGGISFIDEYDNSIQCTPEAIWYDVGLSYFNRFENKCAALVAENVFATTSNPIFSRSIFEIYGGFKDYRYAHDLDFFLFALSRDNWSYNSNLDFVKYRYHRNNTIKENPEAVTQEVQIIVDEFCQKHQRYVSTHADEFRLAAKIRGLKWEN